jgi:hypothetical protein
MQQELAIALGPQDRRLDYLDPLPAKFHNTVPDSPHRHLLRLTVANNAAFADIFAPHLELRLDQYHQLNSATEHSHALHDRRDDQRR